jgi:butyrate kinase
LSSGATLIYWSGKRMDWKILAINPGSTSTKIAIYIEAAELWKKNISHSSGDLALYRSVMDQLEFRCQAVRESLSEAEGFLPKKLSAVVGRGGLLKPLPGGVYAVNPRMKADLASCRYGIHASNLGALIADAIAGDLGIRAYVVDPVVVDELDPLARYSGIPEIPRRSIFHALNQKATAKKAAAMLGKPYGECVFIVAHLGGGTSIGAHVRGRVVDVNNALDGEGPMSIERAGTVPAGDWMRYVLSRQHEPRELQKKLTGGGGFVAYLGTNDFSVIEKAARTHEEGTSNPDALDGALCGELIQAFCYQVSKAISALAAVTEGRLDAVLLTGGLVFSSPVVENIKRRVAFLAPILLFPGENELEALAMGVREVLNGEAAVKTYEG